MKIGGYNFKYVEKGNGNPVIFVHGSVSDYRTWSTQLEEFSKFYHAIAYSRRFHWPNERIAEEVDYSMHQHVSDLEKILGNVKKPVHLIGHSYGAFIGLLLAMKTPHLVRTLVLAEPPVITLFVSNSPKPFEIIKLLFSKPKTALAIMQFGVKGIQPASKELKKNNKERAIEIFGRATLGNDTFSNLSSERRTQVMDNFIKAEFLGSGFPLLNDNQVQELQAPTLLLSGQNSPTLFQFLLDRLEELIPNSERIEIPNASHILHEDNPSAYNKAVLSFFEEKEHDKYNGQN